MMLSVQLLAIRTKKGLSVMVLLFFGLYTTVNAQQDAQYTQYMFQGIYINPAYAGYKEILNMHAFYRRQWTDVVGSPTSMSLAVDASANNGNVGLALQIASDRLGAQNNLSVYGSYAYRLRVGSSETSRLSFGIGAGIVQNGIDYDKLVTIHPEYTALTGTATIIVPDVRAGVFYSDDKFYAGFSADNLLSQYINADKYRVQAVPQPKVHYYLTAGMLFPLTEDIGIKPSFLFKDDRGGPTSADLNVFMIFADKLWIGTTYRSSIKLYDKSYLQSDLPKASSIIGLVEVFASNRIRIGYAYDHAIGAVSGYNGGTHEISIGFYFPKRNTAILSPRYF